MWCCALNPSAGEGQAEAADPGPPWPASLAELGDHGQRETPPVKRKRRTRGFEGEPECGTWLKREKGSREIVL